VDADAHDAIDGNQGSAHWKPFRHKGFASSA
jgi:hypothetical protein